MSELFATRSNSFFSNKVMCMKHKRPLLYVEISMDNFSMSWSCLKLEDNSLQIGTFLLVISSIEATTLLKRSNCFSAIKSSTQRTSFCLEETMNQDKSQLFMAFMIKSSKSMDAQLLGSTSMRPLITYL